MSCVEGLPGPAAVAYEAGPTGFKTDARDALHLARLLRLGEVTSVAVPTLGREAPRDLVRAREDGRGDPMRARHRGVRLTSVVRTQACVQNSH